MLGGDTDYWDVDGETDEPLQAVALPVRDFLFTEPIERNGGKVCFWGHRRPSVARLSK